MPFTWISFCDLVHDVFFQTFIKNPTNLGRHFAYVRKIQEYQYIISKLVCSPSVQGVQVCNPGSVISVVGHPIDPSELYKIIDRSVVKSKYIRYHHFDEISAQNITISKKELVCMSLFTKHGHS